MRALRASPERLFHFRLARSFGRLDVDRFVDQMPSDDYRAWQEFANAEGWASQWELVAEVLAWLNNQTNRVVQAVVAAAGADPDECEWLTRQDILDGWAGVRRTPKSRPGATSVDERKSQKTRQAKR